MATPDPRRMIEARALDAELAALLWLLVEDGIPVVVTGPAAARARAELAADVLSLAPGRAWSIIDADADPPDAERLAALLRGGTSFALLQAGDDLKDWLDRGRSTGLPEDGLRRLGLVIVADDADPGLRLTAVHYLRPSERDGQGHIQRRPPAVLAAWDAERDAWEHYAWGITPELGDRIDRSQADFEDRQRDRAGFVEELLAGTQPYAVAASAYLAAEPERVTAPRHAPAAPSPFSGGLTDPDPGTHTH